jgi:uncharacterized protein YjiK
MHKQLRIFQTICVFGICASVSCQQKKPEKLMAGPYDLLHPTVVALPAMLDEISGVTYDDPSGAVFAISDETGDLYKIQLGDTTRYTTWQMTKKHDYEDVVLLDSSFYVLNSHGKIVRVRFDPPKPVDVAEVEINAEGKNEFEAMYYDPGDKKLKVLCKNCEEDNKKVVTGFVFDPDTGQMSDSSFQLNVKAVDKLMNVKSMKLKPSAAAINPKTGELFVLCSVNKLLVIFSKSGEAKSAFSLINPLYKQPEGMCFTPSGTLIISNESHETGNANLLIFKPR